MNEHPILFSTPMVQAIIEGRKTMTRRIIKPQPDEKLLPCGTGKQYWSERPDILSSKYFKNPYGEVGDILWIREKFRFSKGDPAKTLEEELLKVPKIIFYADDNIRYRDKDKWKPSIHMPKDACRIYLEITDIKVERLQDITWQDVEAEGIIVPPIEPFSPTHLDLWKNLWQSINGEESWNSNPWVWAIEFKVLSTTGMPNSEQEDKRSIATKMPKEQNPDNQK